MNPTSAIHRRTLAIAVAVLALVLAGLVVVPRADAQTSGAAGSAGYVSVEPLRLVDSRVGTGGYATPWGPSHTRGVQVLGVGPVPATGVRAVAMHVTLVDPTAPATTVTVHTTGVATAAATLTAGVGPGQPGLTNNLVIVEPDADGVIDIQNTSGQVDVVIDVVGFFAADAGAAYIATTPTRVLDSRAIASPWGPAETRTVDVAALAGIPTVGLEAVALHITTVAPSAHGTYLAVHAAGTPTPPIASLNVGQNAAHTAVVNDLVIADVDALGRVDIYNNLGTVHLVIDVVGYYANADGSRYVPMTPTRLVDTAAPASPWTAGMTQSIQVAGFGIIPSTGIEAVALSITASGSTAAGTFLTAYPTGEARPPASMLNVGTHPSHAPVVTDLVIAKVDDAGSFDLYNNAGNVDLAVDVVGYFLDGQVPNTVSGQVIDSHGFGAAGIRVCVGSVVLFNDSFPESTAGLVCGYTDTFGLYSLTGVPDAADTIVQFYDETATFGWEYLGDAQSRDAAQAHVFSLVGGQHRAGVDAVLDLAASVAGVVSDGAGVGLENMRVCAALLRPGDEWTVRTVCGQSGVDGAYVLEGLIPGNYVVSFHDETGLRGSTTYPSQITLSPGQRLDSVHAVLAASGSISGAVVNRLGESLMGMVVCVTPSVHAAQLRCTESGADGTYVLDRLGAGAYKVYASEGATTSRTYARTFYGDVSSRDSSPDVVVDEGFATSGVDIAMLGFGTIAGTVTSADARPLAGIDVCAHGVTWWGACATTKADGTYRIEGLEDDSYAVAFIDPTQQYSTEYYDDAMLFEASTRVVVGPGSEVVGIDASLDETLSISGVVTDQVGAPLAGIFVCAHPVDGISPVACGSTGPDGSYAVWGVAPGDYHVRFGDPDQIFVDEWYDDIYDFRLAITVSVVAPVGGIDAVLTVAGALGGSVTDVNGPVPGVDVCAGSHDLSPLGWTDRCATTGADGTYRIAGLLPLEYFVELPSIDPGFVDVSALVDVLAGPDTQHDLLLERGGSIAGRVLDAAGLGVADVEVCVSEPTTAAFDCGYSEPDGSYVIDGLPAGIYDVTADEVIAGLAGRYDGVVVVAPETAVNGIDIVLGGPGAIAGVLTDSLGPVPDFLVCAISATDFLCGVTAGDGTFLIEPLRAGTYDVDATGAPYDNAAIATDVVVEAGQTTTGVILFFEDNADGGPR